MTLKQPWLNFVPLNTDLVKYSSCMPILNLGTKSFQSFKVAVTISTSFSGIASTFLSQLVSPKKNFGRISTYSFPVSSVVFRSGKYFS